MEWRLVHGMETSAWNGDWCMEWRLVYGMETSAWHGD